MDDLSQRVLQSVAGDFQVSGQILFAGVFGDTAETMWVVPEGVFSVSMVLIGGGGGGGAFSSTVPTGCGGAGGSLYYVNNLQVTPGEVFAVRPSPGGAGGRATNESGTAGLSSYITTNLADPNSFLVDTGISPGGTAGGGNAAVPGVGTFRQGGRTIGGVVYTGALGRGGQGGRVGVQGNAYGAGGGGGAAGYSGAGGNGGTLSSTTGTAPGGNGLGGGGGGGGGSLGFRQGGGGGGVGAHGEGISGTGGGQTAPVNQEGIAGTGGSGGTSGVNGETGFGGGHGGAYGAGGGGNNNTLSNPAGRGAPGAIRIIWPGRLRQFPSTRTADE